MGCDIHYVIEQEHNGEWVGVFGTDNGLTFPNYHTRQRLPALQFRDRNYKFFAKLAGVRGPGPDPLGLPEDLSSMSRMYTDSWGTDGHSYSYLPLRDFVAKWMISNGEDITPIVKEKLKGNDPVLDLVEELGIRQIDKYRVVFWFDN